jgi:hypothetical protein
VGCIAYHLTVYMVSITFVHSDIKLAYLVEEDILPIAALSRKILQVAVLVYAVLTTQLLPELTAHYSSCISQYSHVAFQV